MRENEKRRKAGDAIKAQGQQDDLTRPDDLEVVGAEDEASRDPNKPDDAVEAAGARRKTL